MMALPDGLLFVGQEFVPLYDEACIWLENNILNDRKSHHHVIIVRAATFLFRPNNSWVQ